MRISIIGLGLIGGSYALSLKKRFENIEVFGWDENEQHLETAYQLGIIDEKCTSATVAIGKKARWIFLAVPVSIIEDTLDEILDKLGDDQVLVDFGSTKGSICEKVSNHPNRLRFIAAHPIAGTEYSGPRAAFAQLFDDKVMIVCDREKTEKKLIKDFRRQCKILGMTTSYLSALDHDIHVAYVSHLSHAISFALSNTVLDKEESESRMLDLAGSGFASTVRLAKSSPEMWTPIFLKNKRPVLEALDHYIDQIQRFRKLLSEDDMNGINDYLKQGREIRKILD